MRSDVIYLLPLLSINGLEKSKINRQATFLRTIKVIGEYTSAKLMFTFYFTCPSCDKDKRNETTVRSRYLRIGVFLSSTVKSNKLRDILERYVASSSFNFFHWFSRYIHRFLVIEELELGL